MIVHYYGTNYGGIMKVSIILTFSAFISIKNQNLRFIRTQEIGHNRKSFKIGLWYARTYMTYTWFQVMWLYQSHNEHCWSLSGMPWVSAEEFYSSGGLVLLYHDLYRPASMLEYKIICKYSVHIMGLVTTLSGNANTVLDLQRPAGLRIKYVHVF